MTNVLELIAQIEREDFQGPAGGLNNFIPWQELVAAVKGSYPQTGSSIGEFLYPRSVGNHIDQFAENVFVWYDESGLVGGATNYLDDAEKELARYGEQLNGVGVSEEPDEDEYMPEGIGAVVNQKLTTAEDAKCTCGPGDGCTNCIAAHDKQSGGVE